MKHDDKKQKIYDALAKLSILFDNPPSRERLTAFTEFLSRYPMGELGAVFKNAPKACFTFPPLAWFVKELEGSNEKDTALLMSGEIIDSISSFGRYQAKEAREHLGEIAWAAVESAGGWSALCSMSKKELPTTRAQLRELCATNIRTSRKDPALLKLDCEKRTNKKLNGLQPLNKLLTQGEKQ